MSWRCQVLQLPQIYDYWSNDFIGKVLRASSPQLRKIKNNCDNYTILELFPESELRLLSNFTWAHFDDEIISSVGKLVKSRSTLSELDVSFSLGYYHEMPLECLQLAQSLLQSSFNSLGTLHLTPICCLQALSFPRLENSISLKIGSCVESDEMRSLLHLIEFGRLSIYYWH